MSIHYPSLELGNYRFPFWAYQLGWCLTALILSGMILYAIYLIIKVVLIQRKSWKTLINPEDKWGPLSEHDRKKVSYYHGGHQGALVRVFNRAKPSSLSREALTRSKVSRNHNEFSLNLCLIKLATTIIL